MDRRRPPGRPDVQLDSRWRVRHAVSVARRRQEWARLGTQVRQRRVELGFSSQQALASAAGISMRTVGSLERGEPVGFGTISVIERALGWAPGSADNILSGREPMTRANSADPPAEVASTRRRILTATAEELIEMRSLIEEVSGRDTADNWLRDAIRMRDGAAREDVHRDAG